MVVAERLESEGWALVATGVAPEVMEEFRETIFTDGAAGRRCLLDDPLVRNVAMGLKRPGGPMREAARGLGAGCDPSGIDDRRADLPVVSLRSTTGYYAAIPSGSGKMPSKVGARRRDQLRLTCATALRSILSGQGHDIFTPP